MTRKDFEAIAAVIRKGCDNAPTYEAIELLKQGAEDAADWLATRNPRFDRKRFLTACGF